MNTGSLAGDTPAENGPAGIDPAPQNPAAFSPRVHAQWHLASAAGIDAGEAVVAVDPDLPESRALAILEMADGRAVATVTPDRGAQLGLRAGDRLPAADLRERISAAGLELNDPDYLFYLPMDAQLAPASVPGNSDTRLLGSDDAEAFAEFERAAPPADLDEAFVELDHWVVIGTFVGERLVSAASAYPWANSQMADIGVITLPEFRGRGLGQATVRTISAEALARGFEPQYRCQFDNTASRALAAAAGFAVLGRWTPLASEE